MWKKVDGRLVHTTDENRITVQVRIDKDVLEVLSKLAEEHESTPSYLIESGIEYMLDNGIVHPNHTRNIHNRKTFRLGIDKDLYETLMEEVKKRGIKRSDMLEDSIHYIQFDTVKNKNWRFRIE